MRELERFDPELAKRPMIVAVSKLDLPDVRARVATIKRGMKKRGVTTVMPFSAATGEGIHELLLEIERVLREHPTKPAPRAAPLPRGGKPRSADGGEEEEGELEVEYVE